MIFKPVILQGGSNKIFSGQQTLEKYLPTPTHLLLSMWFLNRLELVADPVTQAIGGLEFEDSLMPGSPGDVLSD